MTAPTKPSEGRRAARTRVMEHCAGSLDDVRQLRKVADNGAPIYECRYCGKLVRWQPSRMFPDGQIRAHGRMLSTLPGAAP